MKNRILHAEDDVLFSGIVKKILQQQGFEVYSVFDGEQAWQLFNGMRFHSCLLDIMMPGLNGIDLGERIRTLDKQIPIFYLSGEDIAMVSAEVFGRGGANGYFPKTFNLRELTGKLQASLIHINNYALWKEL
ncbi:response regulator transcription factor [Chitinophaga polysaccharea]|uniref:response regulator transcription factor n=1 Tax=Chitinophaga polysaccharea TaxID=1293035 RepID=UPI00115807F4|nr:response regulator [Chitinophaga polysaccharea]